MVYKTQLWEHISLETKQFKTLYIYKLNILKGWLIMISLF